MARFIFMGSPEFAVPCLARLISREHRPLAVFCQPDRPAGRGKKIQPPPVKHFALEAGLRVEQPEKLDASVIELCRSWTLDFALVVAYGKILPKTFLALPRYGCFNVHASLLPRHRGASPIQQALLAGDTRTGVSLQRMNEGLDTGAIILEKDYAIPALTTGGQLSEVLAQLGAELVENFFDQTKLWGAPGRPQEEKQATYAAKLHAQDRVLRWTEPTELLLRRIHALSPRPGAQAFFEGQPWQILRACSAPFSKTLAAGVVHHDRTRAFVGTGDSQTVCELLEVKPPNGKAMATEACLRGRGFPLAFDRNPS